jgi:hypothetical protein
MICFRVPLCSTRLHSTTALLPPPFTPPAGMRSGTRWTRQHRQTGGAIADGEVVWS